MEKTKLIFASAFLSLLVVCFAASDALSNTFSRGTLTPSVGANRLPSIGAANSSPLKAPDFLLGGPEKTNKSLIRPLGLVANHAPVDFDGDGKTDFVVVRNTGGGPNGQLTWYYAQNGGTNTYGVNWGLNSDWVLTQDFDGDGKSDITIWRPGTGGTAAFYILQSATNTFRYEQFGQTGDTPSVSADYDGDGKADPAVFRVGSPAFWYYHSSATGNVAVIPWGTGTDIPFPGDFDGDGKTDFGIARNDGSGHLQIWRMLSNGTVMPTFLFGTIADYLVPGDYDGDGKTDVATVTIPGGQMVWHLMLSSTGTTTTFFWGTGNDYPTIGDYDADGKTDVAIWRRGVNPGESTFWVHLSSTGSTQILQWGLPGDFPIAASNVF